MNYKGYTARIVRDEDENVFLGQVEGLHDVVTFEAARADDLEREFRASVDEYLAFCAEQGVEPQRPGEAPMRGVA